MIVAGSTRARACAFWLTSVLLIAFSTEGVGQTPPPSALGGGHESATADPSVLPEESSALTLPDALSLALGQSPVLAAFSWDLRASDAMIKQAGLRPNPELSVEVEGIRWTPGPRESGRSRSFSGAMESGALVPSIAWKRETGPAADAGFGESEFTISIAQPLELGRKRAKRVAVAERQKDLALWDYQAARADVLAQTAFDFVGVLVSQERVALEEELVALAEEMARTFSLRVEAGKVSPIELSKAEVELVGAQINQEESRTALEAARAVLAANWGSKRPAFTRAMGRLDEMKPVPALAEMEARVNRNPDLARWSSELAARRAEFRLEKAQRIPDLEVELGCRSGRLAGSKATSYGFGSAGNFSVTQSESGHNAKRDNSLVLGFSLALPVFDRNQGRIAVAEAMISKASEQQRAAEAAVHAKLNSARQTASGAYLKARALQNKVLPKVDETFDKIQQGYQQGKFSYLDVLDTQRTLFEVRVAFLTALAQYHQGVVRMERLMGTTVDEQDPKEQSDEEEIKHER
jgi:outer membrane protein, heavy metal efflux system